MKKCPRERIDFLKVAALLRLTLLCLGHRATRHLDAELFCLQLNSIKITDIFDERQEFKSIAASVTAETVEKALIRNDRKTRCLFGMKGTAPPVTAAFPLQRNICLHHLDKVGSLRHLPDEFIQLFLCQCHDVLSPALPLL